jgi:hypothetical protein
VEHLSKTGKNVRADGVAFVRTDESPALVVRGGDVEMVEPEIHHDFLHLAGRLDGTKELLRDQFAGQLNLSLVSLLVIKSAQRATLVVTGSIGVDPALVDGLAADLVSSLSPAAYDADYSRVNILPVEVAHQ